MPKVTEKYANFIKLERSKGYQNTAVVGGFGALANSWSSEARESGLSEALIAKVLKLLRGYESKTPEERRKDLIELTAWLGLIEIGDFPPALNPESSQPSSPHRLKKPAPAPSVPRTTAQSGG